MYFVRSLNIIDRYSQFIHLLQKNLFFLYDRLKSYDRLVSRDL